MYPPVLNKPLTVMINSRALRIKFNEQNYLQFFIGLSNVSTEDQQFLWCLNSFDKELFREHLVLLGSGSSCNGGMILQGFWLVGLSRNNLLHGLDWLLFVEVS